MEDQPLRIAVVGHTNAGKTSLLRTLTRRADFVEVSDRPGTTRHVERIELMVRDRAAVRFFDTPGLEDAVSLREHIERDTAARLRPRAALLACRAAASPDRGTERLLRELLAHCGDCRLWLVRDADTPASPDDPAAARWRQWLEDCGLARITAHDTLADALTDIGAG